VHIKGGYHCGCHSKSFGPHGPYTTTTYDHIHHQIVNTAVVLVSDVTGTDCHVTSGRSLSIVRWRQLPFRAKARKYSHYDSGFWTTYERIRPHTTTYIIKSSLQGVLYLLVLYVYLLCHCRWNKTHFGLLGLISNRQRQKSSRI